jgi:hypothetical protein
LYQVSSKSPKHLEARWSCKDEVFCNKTSTPRVTTPSEFPLLYAQLCDLSLYDVSMKSLHRFRRSHENNLQKKNVKRPNRGNTRNKN